MRPNLLLFGPGETGAAAHQGGGTTPQLTS